MRRKALHLKIVKPEKIYSTLNRVFYPSERSQKKTALLIPFHLQSDWFLALFEAIQNAFQHGQGLLSKKGVRVTLSVSSQALEARVFDFGPGFEIPRRVRRERGAERGRGLVILKQLTDTLRYHRGKKENYLFLRKKILPPSKRYQVTDLLYEISHRLTQAPRLQKVYDIILDQLIKVFNVERASLMIYDPASAALKVVAARGIDPKLLKKIRVKEGEGISGYVFKRSRPLLIEDVARSERRSKQRSKKYRSRSLISAPMVASPLKVGEETLGVINLTDKRDGKSFTRGELKLLMAIAHQAAAYVKIGALIERLRTIEKTHEAG